MPNMREVKEHNEALLLSLICQSLLYLLLPFFHYQILPFGAGPTNFCDHFLEGCRYEGVLHNSFLLLITLLSELILFNLLTFSLITLVPAYVIAFLLRMMRATSETTCTDKSVHCP